MESKTLVNAFLECFGTGGSLVIDCGACGRTYFGSQDQEFEEGELEDLLAKAKKEPDRYIDNEHYTHWVMFNGMAIVSDCKCGYVERTAKGLWSSRKPIAQFLKTIVEKERARVEEDSALIAGLEG